MSKDPLLVAEALNAEANIHSILNSPSIATKSYEAALEQATSAPRLQLTIMVNQLRHQLDHKIKDNVLQLQENILLTNKSLVDTNENDEKTRDVKVNISIANLLFRANSESISISEWQGQSLALLKESA
ncbi:MAG: hypothetical protein ACI9VI_002555 [Candidatus Azotimanducaceae bacterium]